jgi:hypothetical protein
MVVESRGKRGRSRVRNPASGVVTPVGVKRARIRVGVHYDRNTCDGTYEQSARRTFPNQGSRAFSFHADDSRVNSVGATTRDWVEICNPHEFERQMPLRFMPQRDGAERHVLLRSLRAALVGVRSR